MAADETGVSRRVYAKSRGISEAAVRKPKVCEQFVLRMENPSILEAATPHWPRARS